MNLKILIAASAAAFAMCPTVAQAAGFGVEEVSVTVRYDDLNMASAEGQEQLKQRVDRSIAQICGDRNMPDLASRMAARQCYGSARAGAIRDIQLAAGKARSMGAKA